MKIGTNVCQSHFLHLSSFFIAACVWNLLEWRAINQLVLNTQIIDQTKNKFVTFRRIQRSFVFRVGPPQVASRYPTNSLATSIFVSSRCEALCKHPCTEHCVSRPSQAATDAVIPSLQCEMRFRNMFLLIWNNFFSLAFGSLLSEFMCRAAEWSFVHFKVQSFSVSPQQFFLEAFQKKAFRNFILAFHAWLSARYFSGKRKRFLRLLAHINDRILTSKQIDCLACPMIEWRTSKKR